MIVLLVVLAGCGEGRVSDSRFATPERTVATLLATHGLAELPQDTIRARIVERGAFELRDAETWRQCFVDLDRPGGEGMAGYVLGILAAGRDDLRYELAGERAYAMPREGVRIAFRRGEDGAYRIALRESVPEEVQRGLLQAEESARSRRTPTDP